MRSRFEIVIAEQLREAGVSFLYEPISLAYVKPTTGNMCHYTPDFLLPNGILIELQGWWPVQERWKIRNVRQQYPKLDLRIVFYNAKKPLEKGSRSTYGEVCNRWSIRWADKQIPQAWINEPINQKVLEEIARIKAWEEERPLRRLAEIDAKYRAKGININSEGRINTP